VAANAPMLARYVNLGALCPVVTDHRHTLTLSFTVVNLTATPVTVVNLTATPVTAVAVEPSLPLPGLQLTGSSIAGSTCASPAPAPPGGVLDAGRSLLATFHFTLPDTCPQPLPVRANVRVRADEWVTTDQVGLFSDLGNVPFDTCPPAG
jgi:hypothetical protein